MKENNTPKGALPDKEMLTSLKELLNSRGDDGRD